jgi:endogenous inhibitor of DNA gyrase (YacG/DUF329 family)
VANTTTTVHGPIASVPCAHCGKAQNYAKLEDERAQEGVEDPELQRGMKIECDDCSKQSEIVDIRRIVILRQA